jgi:type IV pilus assembly protein PilX
MKNFTMPSKQNGAALVVGLVLLVVVTVLAVSGMNTATTELAIARNNQNYENAFQAAESGLEQALSQGLFLPAVNVNLVQNINANDAVNSVIQFEDSTLVPDRAYSLGGGGVEACHFLATATASSMREGTAGNVTDRDASAVHTQAFYVVCPESQTISVN